MDLMTYALCKGNGSGGSAKIIEFNVTTIGDSITIDGELPSWEEITSTFNSCGYIVLHNPLISSIVLKSDYATPNGNRHFTSTMIVNGYVTYKCYLEFYEDDGEVKYQGKLYEESPFIVTLTPTAQDFSGTMDKSVAEINTAYEEGKQIWFKVLTSATTYVEVPVSFIGKDTSFEYPNFGAEIVKSDANLMIVAQTQDTNDGTKATYSTRIYSLTPLS